jgi:hypothetical protein
MGLTKSKDQENLVLTTRDIRPDANSIPASEAWLSRNPDAIDAVRRGLQEAAEGKAFPAGPFAPYADDP